MRQVKPDHAQGMLEILLVFRNLGSGLINGLLVAAEFVDNSFARFHAKPVMMPYFDSLLQPKGSQRSTRSSEGACGNCSHNQHAHLRIYGFRPSSSLHD